MFYKGDFKMRKVFTSNIDVFPYTGEKEVNGFLKISEKDFLAHWFNDDKEYKQKKNITRGKIYQVVRKIGYGDVEDFVIIDDNGEEFTLGSFFFEELTEEEYQSFKNNGPQRKLVPNNQK